MQRLPLSLGVFILLFKGVSALTPVFVQTGNDLLLDANGADCSEDSVLIFWRFNEKDNLVRLMCHKGREPTVNKFKYPERTEITEKTSLKLKNCQIDPSFSGVYSAIRSLGEEEVVAKYNVTVRDPVSPAHLKVDSVFNSSDVCNLTVTCSTDHSSVSSSFTCGKETCKQDNGQQTDTSQQGNLLQIHVSNESVICNHSNQVSWANSTKRIEFICHQNDGNTNPGPLNIRVIIPVPVIVIIVVGAIVVLFVWRKRQHNHVLKIPCCCPEHRVNPESATLQAPADQPPGPETPSDTVMSVYSVVQPHTQTVSPRTETRNAPESIYAQVEKPGRTSPRAKVRTVSN
uniref:Ig-like domain-containing protein n=1 Tax=Oryzias latipes TaxID=8090 RepID=A0A3P9LWC5_ORYLA